MKAIVLNAIGLAALCAVAQGCSQKPAAIAAKAVEPGLPAEWRVPVQFQGEWHGQLANCANPKDTTRIIIAVDHLQINDLAGPVQASSTAGPQLTVVARLTGEGEVLQRTFGFVLSDDHNQLTTMDEKQATLVRCPAAKS